VCVLHMRTVHIWSLLYLLSSSADFRFQPILRLPLGMPWLSTSVAVKISNANAIEIRIVEYWPGYLTFFES